jgi:oligosaccharide repeat unit polymerase
MVVSGLFSAFALVLIFTFLMVFVFQSKLSVFSFASIFVALACIDVIIPSFLWSLYGLPVRPYWFRPLNESSILNGLLFYILFLMLFLFSYYLVIRKASTKALSLMAVKKMNQTALMSLLLFFSFMSVVSLLYEIIFMGGFAEWLVAKFTLRFQNDLGAIYTSPLSLITHLIPWRIMLISLVYIGFLYRDFLTKKNRNFLYLLAFIALLLTLSTSYRGSILVYFLGFAFVEFIRFKYFLLDKQKKVQYKKIFFLALLAALIFIVYGSLRDSSVNDFKGVSSEKSSSEVYRILSQGSGIEGVSSIMREYGMTSDFMYGKTYIDMLLMPIPRSIYSSKPEWYGIDDITRGMGWPASTQSAVTMAGEAYANFSYFGLIVAIFYGVSFAVITRVVISSSMFIVLYPTVVIQLILVTNWMGFTGFMNALLKALVVFIVFIVIKKAIFK